MNFNQNYELVFSTSDGQREYDCYRNLQTDELVRVYDDGEETPGTDIDYETLAYAE